MKGATESYHLRKLRLPEFAFVCAILVFVLNIVFFSVIWGGKTLLSSAIGLASILPEGAVVHPSIPWLYPPRTGDPGGAGWFSEPFYQTIHRSIFVDHAIPLWNPDNGCGAPFLANMQSQVLNPVQAIAWLVPGPESADLYVIARLFIAGILTFLYLRQFFLRAPSVCGAISYMLTGYLIIYLGMPDISVCVMVPGLFYAVERLIRRDEFKSILLVAIFSALILLGGMPEVSFLAVVLATIYFISRLLTVPQSFSNRRKVAWSLIFAYTSGMLLAAPQVFPFLEYMRNSFNAHDVQTSAAPGLQCISAWSLHLLSYCAPLLTGPLNQPELRTNPGFTHAIGYCGTSVALLASIGCLALISSSRLSRSARICGIFSAAAIAALMLKKFGFPLVQWIGLLPVFKLVIYWKYAEPFIGFGIACLSALGLDSLIRRRISRTSLIIASFTFLILVIGLFCFSAPYMVFGRIAKGAVIESGIVGLVTVLLSAAMIRKPRRYRSFAWCLVGVVVIDLSLNFIVPTYYKFSPLPPRIADPYKGADYIKDMQSVNLAHERLMGYDSVLYPNWSAAFGIEDIRNQDAMYVDRYFPFLQAFAYGDNVPKLPLANHNLTTRFDGEEAVLDPLQQPENLPRILKLLRVTSTKLVASVMQRTVETATDEMKLAMRNAGPNVDSEHLRLMPVQVGEETKIAIFAHPEKLRATTFSLPATLSNDRPRLQFAMGIDSAAVKRGITDGVNFSVYASCDGQRALLYQEILNPCMKEIDTAWHSVQLDLSPYAGKPIVLEFVTDAGAKSDPSDDRACWADIRITSAASSYRVATNPLPFSTLFRREVGLYAVPRYLPRVCLFDRWEEFADPKKALSRLISPEFDVRRAAVVECKPGEHTPKFTEKNEAIADFVLPGSIVSYSPQKVVIDAGAEHQTLLVLNDTFYPGWVARVDGAEVEIYHANYLFRGVFLEPGTHHVEFSYEPVSFKLGLAAAAAGLMLLTGAFFISRRKRAG